MHDCETEDARPQDTTSLGVVRSSIVRWFDEDSGKTIAGGQIEDASNFIDGRQHLPSSKTKDDAREKGQRQEKCNQCEEKLDHDDHCE